MAEFHFVEDYELMVANLIAKYPIDRAMELAVGDRYESIGDIEVGILQHAGLIDGMSLFDLGCGSGRLAHALGKSYRDIKYIGTDVVQDLLNYAATKSPVDYIFKRHAELSIPVPDSTIDIACAFSVFTHLLHTESYIYLGDFVRALKPGGKIIFSFLEFVMPGHWDVFSATVDQQRKSNMPHLNNFIERNAIEAWCKHLPLKVIEFIDGDKGVGVNPPLGQSVAVLMKI